MLHGLSKGLHLSSTTFLVGGHLKLHSIAWGMQCTSGDAVRFHEQLKAVREVLLEQQLAFAVCNCTGLKRHSSGDMFPSLPGAHDSAWLSTRVYRASIPMRTLSTLEPLRSEKKRWALTIPISPNGSTIGRCRWRSR